MAFQDLVQAAQKYFPSLQIQYKDQSSFMKFLGFLLFFNKSFMADYTTTVGNTVYLPSANYVKLHPVSGSVVFLHELVHLHDHKRVGSVWFHFSYLAPQIFVIPALLLFLLSWKIALPITIFFLLPLPSYFRMIYERRAYYASMYCLKKLGDSMNFDPQLSQQASYFAEYFIDSSYYFMWPFSSIIDDDFTAAAQLVAEGKRPYEDPVFDILDDLITKI